MKKPRIARRQRRAAQLALRKRRKKQGRQVALLHEDRRGSVIVVVIALLSALMFLGFVFFSLSSQEYENSQYFKEASKKIEPLDFDPNDIFDCFLEQLILGAPDQKYNSVFWGGKVSLLPTMFGTDASPYNGEGTNAIWHDPDGVAPANDGYPLVDRDYDGQADQIGGTPAQFLQAQRPLWICLRPGNLLDPNTGAPYAASTDAKAFDLVNGWGLPEPDVNYVSPDHNFPMLSYLAWTYNTQSGNTQSGNFEPVVIPAGHRPALLRNRVGTNAGQWYTAAETLPYVMRPHEQTRAVTANGIITDVRRYHTDFFTGQPSTQPGSSVPTPVEGVWQNLSGPANINYDADPMGRGVNNAVYLDCDFPIQTDPNTGDQFVPLIAVVMIDGESLINLNVHGNDSEYVVRALNNTIGDIPDTYSLSRSNLGVSRSEINPLWAILTDHTTATPAEQQPYIDYYGGWATNPTQLANMELMSLLRGRAEITAGVATQAYPGRWGESDLVISAWNSANKYITDFPRAGRTFSDPSDPRPPLQQVDDNNNANEGRIPAYAFSRVNPHPYDVYGVGSITQEPAFGPLYGYHRYLPTGLAGQGSLTYPGYKGYAFSNLPPSDNFPYATFFGGGLVNTPINPTYRQVIDDAEEMVVDNRYAGLTTDDSPFSAAAWAALQMSRTDLNQLGSTSALENLAPFTFTQSDDEEEIRSRLTTISYQLKTHGAKYPNNAPRTWEWGSINDNRWVNATLNPVFPPTVPLTTPLTPPVTTSNPQPFRSETFELLMSIAGDNRIRTLQRKLSVNGVLDRVNDGSTRQGFLRIRPLTEHYINPNPGNPAQDLGPTPISPASANITSNDPKSAAHYPAGLNPRQQEYFARYDRQRLCRDIYTLLYLFGGGNDAANYLTTPTHTPAECKEMAQFAVNLVDQMDTDDVVTMFEYDINLSDGWSRSGGTAISDYPYPPNHSAGDRYYVYGVEEQTLCFNEGLAIFAPAVDDSNDPGTGPGSQKADHEGTEWNDLLDFSFLFFELQNASPRPVSFANDQWQIVVRPLSWTTYDTTMPGNPVGEEKRLTLDNTLSTVVPSFGVGTNSILSFGTVGAKQPQAGAGSGSFAPAPIFPEANFPQDGIADGAAIGPARFRVDPEFMSPSTVVTPTTIVPSLEVNDASMNYVDLLRNEGAYQVYDSAPSNEERDGTLITSTPTNPSGGKLLDIDNSTALDFDANDYRVELVLRRRANPYRVQPTADDNPESLDNPWIVVDRIHVPLQEFMLANEQATGADIEGELNDLRSISRYQPLYGQPEVADGSSSTAGAKLDRYNVPIATGTPQEFQANTIGTSNEDALADNTLWHPHYNRPYTSLAEVLNVPLFGPDRLDTPLAPEHATSPWRGLTVHLAKSVGGVPGTDGTPPDTIPDLRLAGIDYNDEFSTFGVKALNPGGPDFDNGAPDDNNRWFRLLEFVEVPSRMNRSLEPFAGQQLIGNVNGSQTVLYRDPGPLNPNTMSSSLALGALLDDPSVINVPTPPTTGGPVSLVDQGGNGASPTGTYDWWELLMRSRDGGDDPIYSTLPRPALPLPGVPGRAVPFRPLESTTAGPASIQNTILRTNPIDLSQPPTAQKRHLFELGDFASVTSPAADQDYAFKHRLLGKVMNHTTTQSNTFVVFLQVDYFRATEEDDLLGSGGTVTQIHEKLPTSPGYRGVFVIDRSLAPELITPDDIPIRNAADPDAAKTFSFNPNFNWRSLLVHRQRIN